MTDVMAVGFKSRVLLKIDLMLLANFAKLETQVPI